MKINYKKYLLSAALMFAAMPMVAQGLNAAYYTKDYKYRHTMNPAFDNNQSYVAIPVLGNIDIQTQSNFGYDAFIFKNPMYGISSDKKNTTFMSPYISVDDALSGFNTGTNRLQGEVNLTMLSAGFKAWGGYNTISLNSRISFGMGLPYELFEFAKNTGNQRYDIGDINVNAQAYVELGLGHSRKINDHLRLGAKLKFLFGIARADAKFENMVADLSDANKWLISGKAKVDMSMKGFQYKTTTETYKSRPGSYEKIDDIDVDGAGLGGFGMAVDLGGVYKLNDDWTFNAAIIDLGFINWSENHVAESSGETFEFDGFHDVTVKGEGEDFGDKGDKYTDQLTDFANLEAKGKESRTTMLGATLNVGAEYNLPVYRKLTFGALSTTRIQGDYTWTEGRISANWEPTKWLDGGMSFAVNNFTTSMGWILNFHPKGFNFFVGMDHILGSLSKECVPVSGNASLTMGMNITW